MQGHLTRAGAVAVAALLILSGLPAGIVGTAVGGTPTVQPDSPDLNVTAETRAVGAPSNVSVAYNLTGEMDASNVSLQSRNGTATYDRSDPGTTEGTANLTVPAAGPGGDRN